MPLKRKVSIVRNLKGTDSEIQPRFFYEGMTAIGGEDLSEVRSGRNGKSVQPGARMSLEGASAVSGIKTLDSTL
jgi:hypothetical protein